MKVGEEIAFWRRNGISEGDLCFGTLLSIQGEVARVKAGGKEIKVFTNYIY